MTDVNHRRKNKLPVNLRFNEPYHNGYAYANAKHYHKDMKAFREELDANNQADVRILGEGRSGAPRIGRTDYLDKSMHGWSRKSNLADNTFAGVIGNDFSKGHRGMARSVKGAKKFVRSRVRFNENTATKKLDINE